MRIMTRCAIAAVTIVSALVLAATPANAATGRLILHGPGPDVVAINPSPGCRSTTFEFTEVTNHTDVPVTVYTGIGCTGFSLIVNPGATMPVGDRHSVLVPA